MPFVVVMTNISREKIPQDFPDKLTAAVTEVTGYHKDLVTVMVLPDTWTLVGGSQGVTTVRAILYNCGWTETDANGAFCNRITDIITENVNVDRERVVLILDKPPTTMCSIGGVLTSAMPFVVVMTNVSREKIPQDFPEKMMSAVSEVTGSDKELVCVMVLPDIWTVVGETTGVATVRTIIYSRWPETDAYDATCKRLTDVITENINVDREKVILILEKPKPTMCSLGGILVSSLDP